MEPSTTTGQEPDQPSPTARIVEYGWRQGCVLPPSMFHALRVDGDWTPDPSVDIAVVLTGDCNVQHHDLSHEPVVDVVCGRVVPDSNGNYTNRKHPRVLHLTIAGREAPAVVEFVAWRRATLVRLALAEAPPSESPPLTAPARRMLADWWAIGRYQRSSFPNAFNKRFQIANGKKRVFEHLMKEMRDEVLAVYLIVVPDEDLPPEKDYRVILRVVLTEEASEDPATLARVEKQFYEPFFDQLNGAEGIDVVDHNLLSEKHFPMSDFRRMARLEFDYLSYYGADEGDMGPFPPRS